MYPEVAEAIRIADDFLSDAPIERQKELALAIQNAILRHANKIAMDIIAEALRGGKLPS